MTNRHLWDSANRVRATSLSQPITRLAEEGLAEEGLAEEDMAAIPITGLAEEDMAAIPITGQPTRGLQGALIHHCF